MTNGLPDKLALRCPRCNRDNNFDQPYAYHAGFSDQGFMYSDSGHCTLVYSDYDPVIKRFFPIGSRFSEDGALRERFEQALRQAPDGGRWRFSNPARCLYCSGPISGTNLQQIYYLVYPDSIITDQDNQLNLEAQLIPNADALLSDAVKQQPQPKRGLWRIFERKDRE